MREVQFQGSAKAMPFDPIRVSNANVEQIARQGAQTLKYMDMAAKQDLENRRNQIEALTNNAEFERKQLNRREELKSANRRDMQEQRQRNFEVELQSIKADGLNQERLYAALGDFSSKAFKLANDFREKRLEKEWDQEYLNTLVSGVQPQEQLDQLEKEHKLRQLGEHYETRVDMVEAQGADPFSVESLRALNPNRRHARLKASAFKAGQEWKQEALNFLETNNEFKLLIDGEELTPVQAVKSDQQAAFLAAYMPEYLKQRGLYGQSATFLGESLLNIRRGTDEILSATRRSEAAALNEERISQARDAAFDTPSDPFVQLDYFRTLARSKDENGVPIGMARARQVWLKDLFMQTDGNGNFRYTEEDIERILAQPFDGPDRTPIGDRFSAEIAGLRRERSNELNKLYAEQNTTKEREWGEWNSDVRDYLNQNPNIGNDQIEQLLEKAQREGNAEGVRMLQTYMTDLSNDGRNDKMYEEIWTSKAVSGLLTVEEVRTANVSDKLKLQWMDKARESEANAIPKEMRSAAEEQIKAALARRIRQTSTQSIKDESYNRAVYAATEQFLRDYTLYMNKPGATASEAEAYAMGRFQKEFQDVEGKYRAAQVDPKTKLRRDFFPGFVVAPTGQIAHPLTFAREKVKADPDALRNEGLLDRGELQRISNAAKAGKPFTIPKSAQYLADMMGGTVKVSDVLNAQMAFYGIDQIPIKGFERAASQLDPGLQRLLSYKPNRTRYDIASYGSGSQAAIPARRIAGKVNTPSDILSTWLAAGGDPKQAVLMTAIAMAESSGRQDAARSDTDVHGWFQVRYPVHVDKLRALGITSRSQLLDPMNNTKAAQAILKSQGLGAWEAYTNGAYKRFMPQAEAAMKSFGNSPWRQGPVMNFNVVQYLTGDTGYRHPKESPQFYYAADHGGSNYHEHVGFRTKEDRDRAVAMLRREGVKIGSMNDGVHADGSLHYQDRAVDLPMPMHIKPGSREERAYSRRVRQLLGIPG